MPSLCEADEVEINLFLLRFFLLKMLMRGIDKGYEDRHDDRAQGNSEPYENGFLAVEIKILFVRMHEIAERVIQKASGKQGNGGGDKYNVCGRFDYPCHDLAVNAYCDHRKEG